LWSVAGKEVKPCDHAMAASRQGCHIEDDMHDLYTKMVEADGIIFGSPVYFRSVSAQAKLVMDRTYAHRRQINRLQGNVGGTIAVAGRRGQVEALTMINNFFLGRGMNPLCIGVNGGGSEKGELRRMNAQSLGPLNWEERWSSSLKRLDRDFETGALRADS